MPEDTRSPLLSIYGVCKTYPPDTEALRDVTVHVAQGEIVALLGPSGCGKSTLLRLIAGLEDADSGELLLDGRPLDDVPVHKRNFGLMFQEFALFPHRDVAANVGFGLRMAGLSRNDTEARVAELLALVSLEGYGRRKVHELSGGERQRVALARSLAPRPRLLMLDEPLGDLDRALREGLLGELRYILKSVGQTALYVTHDQQEAYAIADRMAIMHRGSIEQIGTPQAVFKDPSSARVAAFLGLGSLVPARVEPDEPQVVVTPVGSFDLGRSLAPGEHTLLIRPDAGSLTPPSSGTAGSVAGTVAMCSFRGSRYRLALIAEGAEPDHRLEFELSARATTAGDGIGAAESLPDIGQSVTVHLSDDGLQLIGG